MCIRDSPSTTVKKFLNNLSSKNLKGACDVSSNPSWGSYETFSNPNSGFGSVDKIAVENVSTKYNNNGQADVVASYNVTDKKGNTSAVSVTYGLKESPEGWKITSYKINSSKKK